MGSLDLVNSVTGTGVMDMKRTATIVLLLGALLLVGTAPASAQTSYGSTGAPDRVLRAGCHGYRYHYWVHPPTNDWVLETFLVNRYGKKVASGSFISGYDPRRGHGRFRLCRYSTRPGLFKIKAKLSWYSGYDGWTTWLKPSYFRLRRA